MLMFAAFAVIFVCASNGYAQEKMPPQPMMVGGYKSVSVKDAAVKKAAQFAVSDQSQKTSVPLKIVRIQKAEQQVVAGMNYRLCLEVKPTKKADGDKKQFVLAVVYQDLQKALSLTNWQPGACAQ